MPDYSKGKIYAIKSYQCDDIYIGSTVNKLSDRLSYHKTHYKSFLNDAHNYMTSFEILQFDDAFIELIEEYPCENRNQLNKKEGEYIMKNNKCVNKCIAGRSAEELEKTEKRINKKKEYKQSEKYKIYQNEYNKTETARNARKEYEKSEKCQAYRKAYRNNKNI